MSKIKVGLMGFGEIGRDVYRLSLSQPEMEVVAISDIGRSDILHYLLKNDGRDPVDAKLSGNFLIVGDHKARLIHGVEPKDVPWDAFDVDIVIDTTHKYRTRESMQAHLDSGAKRVILGSLPQDTIDRVIVMGVNDETIKASDTLVSAASATTNALALMLDIIDKAFGIEYAMMTTIHAYTSDQPLRDTAAADFRRSRSAAENIIPNVNISPYWMEHILPRFKGKIEGSALNVPVPMGSLLDLTCVLTKGDTTIEEVNAAMRKAAKALSGYIEITEDPIVSSDVIGNAHSLLFDTKGTMKSSKRMVKTLSWYDNSLGQAGRLVDLALAYGRLGVEGGAA
ncbi:MAG: glyceraldehyde-3-phosphate dehydrogenase [Candidatus Marinimicrobia bacterium]|nr:glyceraldehyde-3-phosphate dehydrogenase [Candidatus Neomarinimicrobiota bacterium]MCF7921875.1 glyceraldehyde-3-phosphate dehydrogenase [Candidatus Neomarinimicrobiota bacterium]